MPEIVSEAECAKRLEEMAHTHAVEIAHLKSVWQHHRDAYLSLWATIGHQQDKIDKLEARLRLLDACRY